MYGGIIAVLNGHYKQIIQIKQLHFECSYFLPQAQNKIKMKPPETFIFILLIYLGEKRQQECSLKLYF